MLVSQNGGKTSAVNNENQVDTVQVDNGKGGFHFTYVIPFYSSCLDPLPRKAAHIVTLNSHAYKYN